MSSPSASSDLQAPISDRESDAEVLVRVEGVSKIFCRDLKKSLKYGIQDSVKDLFSFNSKPLGAKRLPGEIAAVAEPEPKLRPGEFHAVKNVSFELRRGECLGLIGRNGAGKTTLLKMLNGLIKPDSGRIEMRGRVGALIALGAGFNPILSGRENIYVNGSVLGLTTEEIDAKIDDIIDFAEISEFIDAPVQTYSSGMQVRLGFAIATAMEPDILILDEVLAVGDADFRTKCLVRVSSILETSAVIFVSHAKEQLIRICSKGIVINQGRAEFTGDLTKCYSIYDSLSKSDDIKTVEYRHEQIGRASLVVHERCHVCGDDCLFSIQYESTEDQDLSLHVIAILDDTGAAIGVVDLMKISPMLLKGQSQLDFKIRSLALKPGKYYFSLEVASDQGKKLLVRTRFDEWIIVSDSINHWCTYTPLAVKVEKLGAR